MEKPTRVLFVCLGNICRSPLAEGIFRHLVAAEGREDEFVVDSAGTGAWHVGEPPDPRAARVAQEHGVRLEGRARQLTADDLRRFDYMIVMDLENLEAVEELQEATGSRARVHLLREFDPEAEGELEVPDPYYGGPGGFERVYRMIERSCRGLLEALTRERTGA